MILWFYPGSSFRILIFFVIWCYSLSYKEFCVPLRDGFSTWNLLVNHLYILLLLPFFLIWYYVEDNFVVYIKIAYFHLMSWWKYITLKFFSLTRTVLGLSHSPLCLYTSFSFHSCWSSVSLFTVFWLWLGLERSNYSHMVRLARGSCIVTFAFS